MSIFALFLAQVAIYAAVPLYLASLKSPVRVASFYVYIGIVLVIGGFLGAVYSLPLAESLNISGGNLAYGALFMTTVLLVIIERNVEAVRHVIRLVIVVNVFKFALFSLLNVVLTNDAVINPFDTAAGLFSQSLFVVILGGVLIILELLILLFIFERIKKRVSNILLVSGLYTLCFVAVLCLDGVLFPMIALPFNPQLIRIMITGVTGKLVMGLAYSVPMLLFLIVYRRSLTEFVEQPLILKELLQAPKEKLVEEIQRQRDSLALSEEQLRAYAQRLSLATESAGLGIWDLDMVTNTLVWDQRSYELYGIQPDSTELTFTSWEKSLHPEDRTAALDEYQAAIASGTDYYAQFRVVWPDGQIRHLEAYAKVQRAADGSPQRMTGINQDITLRKQMALENEQLAAQFYQAQRMESIGRLAGGIAHDFNNLLVPISGFSELGMMKSVEESQSYVYFERIKEAAERAAGLTRQILAFSRQQVMEMKMTNLNDIVTQFQSMIQRVIGEHINLQLNLTSEPGSIIADKGQIEQVLMNLVVNARDAMPDGGKLTITTGKVHLDEYYVGVYGEATPGPYMMLSVSDTGLGMDEVTKQRVFVPFFTTKPQGEGTGLGLPTVFGIVKQHQGSISIYSELGHGTIFKIYLPATDLSAQELEDVHLDDDFLYGTETVLVVDDELRVRQIVSDILAAHGYCVLVGEDAETSKVIAADNVGRIDLLLTDLVMPGKNGRQLYEELLLTHPQLKVLYMSGYTDDIIGSHSLSNNFSHRVGSEGIPFLSKPFLIHDLLRKVRDVLAEKSSNTSPKSKII